MEQQNITMPNSTTQNSIAPSGERLSDRQASQNPDPQPGQLSGQHSPQHPGGSWRIGHGYDVHRLVAGRRCVIGGVEIPHERGLLGHSDADVLTHAVMDAILGALALGDIGQHFPDSDPRYKNADSLALLRHVAALMQQHGWQVGNLDTTVIAQAPKLAPYIPQMRERLAAALAIAVEQVSVKATTEEGLGFTGAQEGVAAHCVCLLKPS